MKITMPAQRGKGLMLGRDLIDNNQAA